MTVLADAWEVYAAGGKNLRAVLDNVERAMDELSPRAVRHVLGGALTGAQNEGRLAAAEQGDVDGVAIASEVNDSNTCGPCRKIHGKILGRIDEPDKIRKHYPGGGFGGYVKCEGRERCRGTVRYKFAPTAVEPGAPDELDDIQ